MTLCDQYDDQVIENYVLGELPEALGNELEAHCFACDACFARVRQLQTLRDRLVVATDPSLDGPEPRPPSRWRRWGKPFLAPQSLALAATVTLVVLGLGRQQLDRLQSQFTGSRQPRTAFDTVTLQGDTRASGDGVPVVAAEMPVVLEFDLPGAPADAVIRRVAILDAADVEHWTTTDLPPANEYGTRVVMLSPGFLEAGSYRLEVQIDGRDAFVFSFRVLAAATP